MSGNVLEWTSDGYGDYGGSETDPAGASDGPVRVLRGGSWNLTADVARAAGRSWVSPGSRVNFIGFRLSRTIP